MTVNMMSSDVTRREFLKRLSFTTAGIALSVKSLPETIPKELGRLRRAGSGKKIVVIGAGLAGLSAGYELVKAGHDVTILEARARPGGRVYTLREQFSEGLYAEAGATRIPDNHDLTLQYVKHFDLTLIPFRPSGLSTVYYVGGGNGSQ